MSDLALASELAAPHSDEELMHAWARGDERASGEFVRRYAPFLARLLYRKVGRPHDAQDLVQQTFLQVHRARGDFRLETRIRPWIVTIALNQARDLLRRRRRRPETAIEDTSTVATVAAPAVPPVDLDLVRRVRAAVAALPPRQRQVIELHWFGDLSLGEIAARVGATVGTVRVRAHRAYTSLRKKLAALDDRIDDARRP